MAPAIPSGMVGRWRADLGRLYAHCYPVPWNIIFSYCWFCSWVRRMYAVTQHYQAGDIQGCWVTPSVVSLSNHETANPTLKKTGVTWYWFRVNWLQIYFESNEKGTPRRAFIHFR
jgi:hypothetical protein